MFISYPYLCNEVLNERECIVVARTNALRHIFVVSEDYVCIHKIIQILIMQKAKFSILPPLPRQHLSAICRSVYWIGNFKDLNEEWVAVDWKKTQK